MNNNIRVQIVYPNDGWILQEHGEYLANNIEFAHASINKPNNDIEWDITYFVNYELYQPCNSKIVGGWFTHEKDEFFKKIALKMDFTVSPSLRYKKVLDEIRGNNYHIPQPANLERLEPKLVLGFSGIIYRHGRKGEDLLKKIMKLPYVKVKITGGRIPKEKMIDFYNSIDYVIITSKIEGGPMALLEGLACGKEIITSDVGMVPEFKNCKYVHVYDRENPQTLFDLLEKLYKKRLEIRKCVEHLTIENYAAQHKELFLKLIQNYEKLKKENQNNRKNLNNKFNSYKKSFLQNIQIYLIKILDSLFKNKKYLFFKILNIFKFLKNKLKIKLPTNKMFYILLYIQGRYIDDILLQ
ncbi:MAG: glycosyltransferase [Promethearchaeia archaeon]